MSNLPTSDKFIAWVRTVLPAAWSAAVVTLAEQLGLALTELQATWLILAVFAVIYAGVRAVEDRIPAIARLVLWFRTAPKYPDAVEATAQEV